MKSAGTRRGTPIAAPIGRSDHSPALPAASRLLPGWTGAGRTATARALTVVLLLALVFLTAACTSEEAELQPGPTVEPVPTTEGQLAPTPPQTGDVDAPTPEQIEGPYFRGGAPEKMSFLEPGVEGEILALSGRVITTEGAPVEDARIDFWHADERGEYDDEGFRYRGHQITPADGSYSLETIIPGSYAGRTPHLHVKIMTPRGTELITQLYFPAEEQNETDQFFDERLLVQHDQQANDALEATFEFVLEE
jgi:protocatechuate 3,4-dioxygenase beta subunit